MNTPKHQILQFDTASFLAAKIDTNAAHTQYQHKGMMVPGPLELILKRSADEAQFYVYADAWIRYEFNLPKALRELCERTLLRIMSAEVYASALRDGRNLFAYGGESFRLHEQSPQPVLETAPLVAVSMRQFNSELFAVSHVWAVRTTAGETF